MVSQMKIVKVLGLASQKMILELEIRSESQNKSLLEILQNHPESDLADDALILIGKSYYYLGDFPPAERKFLEVISNYPNSNIVFEATLFLARTYSEQNKIENALLILDDLIKRTDVPEQVKGEANFEQTTLQNVIQARASATQVKVDPNDLSFWR